MNLTLDIPPGIVKLGTEYQSSGRWTDGNLVRWVEGQMRPVGGWRSLTGGAGPAEFSLTGKARGSHAWKTNSAVPYMAIGTHSKLYIYTGSDVFDVTPAALASGLADTTSYSGYSVGPYGRGAYGVPRTTAGATALATTWALDNFGQYLLAVNSSDGRLCEWTGNVAVAAAAVTASAGVLPTGNKSVFVTEERFAMLLGAGGNPRKVQWSDQENYTDWEITATKQAGDFELQTVGTLRVGRRVRGANLLLTDTDVHVGQYVGPPLIYGFERVGTGCGVVSPQACAVTDGLAVWMSWGSFYAYDGAVRPLPCSVSEYVFGDLNYSQIEKVFAVRVPVYREIWWFYPSSGSTENDRYVAYNYVENTWAIGQCGRTTGVPRGVFGNQIYVGADGKLYEHESGQQYSGATPYCESGPVELGEGERVYRLNRSIPDEKTAGQVQVRFRSRFYPNGPATNFGPYTLSSPTSLRLTGRQISIRLESAGAYDWRVGRFRFDATPMGER